MGGAQCLWRPVHFRSFDDYAAPLEHAGFTPLVPEILTTSRFISDPFVALLGF